MLGWRLSLFLAKTPEASTAVREDHEASGVFPWLIYKQKETITGPKDPCLDFYTAPFA